MGTAGCGEPNLRVTVRAMPTELDILNELLERVRVDHLAWINGDSSGYEFTDERSTIMGAFGGSTIGATTATPGQRRAVAQFESGFGSVELINGGVSGDAAWLVMIEYAMVTFTGHASPVRWDLRATEAFERRDGEWVRVHRHADPLVDRHPVEEVLTLLP
jgi:hypothetical protein